MAPLHLDRLKNIYIYIYIYIYIPNHNATTGKSQTVKYIIRSIQHCKKCEIAGIQIYSILQKCEITSIQIHDISKSQKRFKSIKERSPAYKLHMFRIKENTCIYILRTPCNENACIIHSDHKSYQIWNVADLK